LLGVFSFSISTKDIVQVEELMDLNFECWKTSKTEIAIVERKRKLNQDKLLGLKFSTQDRNDIFVEQAKDLEEKKLDLSVQKKSRLLLTTEVSQQFSIVVEFDRKRLWTFLCFIREIRMCLIVGGVWK